MHTVSIGGEDLALSTAELQLLKLFSESASAIGDGRANLKVICKTFLTQVFKPILIFQAISTKKTAGLSDLDLTNAVGFINSKLANFMKTSKQISSIKNTKELNAIAEGLLNKTTAVIDAANAALEPEVVVNMEDEEEDGEDLQSLLDGETEGKPEPRVSPRKAPSGTRIRASSPVEAAMGQRPRSPSPFPSDPESGLDNTAATGVTDIDDNDLGGHIYIPMDLPARKVPGQDGQITNLVSFIIYHKLTIDSCILSVNSVVTRVFHHVIYRSQTRVALLFSLKDQQIF